MHTHVNCAQQVTPLVGEAARMVLDSGFRDVRNQGVLLRGVNTAPERSAGALLHAPRSREDHAVLLLHVRHDPERRALADVGGTRRRTCSIALLGYMPGFATPRVICDVPFVGKRWVHMLKDYDRTKGISSWTKNYRTGIEDDDPEALSREYVYFDPIYTLPEDGPGVVARTRSRRACPTRTGSSRRRLIAVSRRRARSRRPVRTVVLAAAASSLSRCGGLREVERPARAGSPARRGR